MEKTITLAGFAGPSSATLRPGLRPEGVAPSGAVRLT